MQRVQLDENDLLVSESLTTNRCHSRLRSSCLSASIRSKRMRVSTHFHPNPFGPNFCELTLSEIQGNAAYEKLRPLIASIATAPDTCVGRSNGALSDIREGAERRKAIGRSKSTSEAEVAKTFEAHSQEPKLSASSATGRFQSAERRNSQMTYLQPEALYRSFASLAPTSPSSPLVEVRRT